MIYTPAEDSHLLEDEIKKIAHGKSFLDMGSGSGIQAKAAMFAGASSILAVDINPESVILLKKEKIKSIKSDLFKNVRGNFDIIAFNPPYLPEDKREDKESSLVTAGGKKGDELILRFLKQAPKHLNADGIILLVISSLTPRDKILSLLEKLNLHYTSIAKKNLFFEALELWEIRKI